MSNTTQILFNSPALHSLKRDQLVKLCKIHSIKANGKNVDLVEKLKDHAKNLPSDDPLSVAARSEQPGDDEEERQERQEALEDKENSNPRYQMPRPSEQWEIVMDTIDESEEGSGSQPGTLRSIQSGHNGSAGEFGTGSSKTSSMSSSIKALATSLGLKRNNGTTKSNLTTDSSYMFPSTASSSIGSHRSADNKNKNNKHSAKDDDYLVSSSIPYASLADAGSMPQMDHFTFSESSAGDTTFMPRNSSLISDPDDSMDMNKTLEKPIPGHPLYPGLPAPSNARLSLGQNQTPSKKGSTTTIRLVSAPYVPRYEPETPQLRPFETAFDLVAGTPGVTGGSWAASPVGVRMGIYPSLAGFEDHATAESQEEDEDIDMPGTFDPPKFTVTTPSKADPSSIKTRASPAAFVFGSPLPQSGLSNAGFSNAAASVLDEMNKRLADAGVDGLGMDILERKRISDAGLSLSNTMQASGGDRNLRFDHIHEREFSKMDGIDKHYAARRAGPNKHVVGMKRKSDALGVGKGVLVSAAGKRRVSGAGTKRRASGARVASNGARKNIVPGSFGDDEEEDVDQDEDENRRQSKRPKFEKGRRVSIAPPPKADDGEEAEMTQEERDKESKRLAKEREAIKRKLEINKQRRRSSMGRPSVGGRGFVAQKPKAQASRFGFLSSAKSLVQSVWNKGGVATKTSGIPISKSTATAAVKPAHVAKKVAGSSPIIARPSTTTTKNISSTSRIPSGGSTSSRNTLKPPSTAVPGRTRSPIPSFGNKAAHTSSADSRANSSIGALSARPAAGNGSSRFSSRNSTATSTSMGTRNSAIGSSRVSSLGVRAISVNTAGTPSMGLKRDGSGVDTSINSSLRARTSSRLLAPTASSLAKTQGNARAPPPQEHLPSRRSYILPAAPAKQLSSLEDSRATLGQVTNSPTAVNYQSPRAGQIFSQPLSPSMQQQTSLGAVASTLSQKPPVPVKPKVLPGRKPRISRSKVIAKLASQRAASGSSTVSGPSGKTRSSMGAGKRQSLGGAKLGRGSAGGENIIMSAKKRARQSEYARRRSRATTTGDGDRLAASRVIDVDIN